MSAARPHRVAVIGAGITGLAAAQRLTSQDPGVIVTVYELSDRVGGIIQTIERDGFLIERGPDSFITNKPGAVQLCEEIGFSDQLIPTDATYRHSLVLRNGRPLPVPDGFMLMAPTRPWSILTTSVLSWRGKFRLLGELLVARRVSDDDESLASFVRRRFGNEALDRLVQPLIGGIYTSDPEKLSLRATLPRFPDMEKQFGSVIRGALSQQKQMKTQSPLLVAASGRTRSSDAGTRSADSSSGSGARYGLFLTARRGLSSMADAVSKACGATGRVTIELSQQIRAIGNATTNMDDVIVASGRPSSAWTVQTGDGTSPRVFDAVIVSAPTNATSRMLAGEQFEGLRSALSAIEYASSAIVVTAHRLADFRHPLNAFGLVIPYKENRNTLAISFSSRKFPGRAPEGCVLLRSFVGGAMQPELLTHDDDTLIRLVDADLRSILGMHQTPMFADVVRYSAAMPQYHVGHLSRVTAIEREVAVWPGLELAGAAYHGVGIPDCVTSGRSAADRVLRSLTALPSPNG